ncbi:unnamed protein product, partial [Owenia fusiformis]
MSRHEGVSCDSCLKGNFRGRRYKCLICYDYDLCATCYEAGATTTRHTADHAMQCILTRTDFDLFYGGEGLTAEQPQAFTCPYCSKMGLTETSLQEHVTAEHAESSLEVVCPICAALPGGDPNHVTDDFTAHLTLEHRAPRDFDEQQLPGVRHVRRIPHPGRGLGGTRARRQHMHFSSASSALSALSPSGGREQMDPIAELLSQLSSVRNRAAAAQSVSSQLQQLEAQLQTTRQQLERLPRRQGELNRLATSGHTQIELPGVAPSNIINNTSNSSSNSSSQYLLARVTEPELTENERLATETDRADRSLFIQELLLSSMTEHLQLNETQSRNSVSSSSSATSFNASDTDSAWLTPDSSLHNLPTDGATASGGLHKEGASSVRQKSVSGSEPPKTTKVSTSTRPKVSRSTSSTNSATPTSTTT